MTSPEPASDSTTRRPLPDVDVLVVGRGHHRYLPAVLGAPSGLLRPAPRGRRRRRRHVVLEPVPRSALRLGELHLCLPLLAGTLRGLAMAGAFRRAARDRALPEPRGRPLRPPTPHALRRPGRRPRTTTRRPASGPWWTAKGGRSGPGTSLPPPVCSRSRTSPTCRGGSRSQASRITRDCGRPSPSISRASGSPSSAPARAACRSSRSSPRRPPPSPCSSAHPTGARPSTMHPSLPRNRPSCGRTSRRCARR